MVSSVRRTTTRTFAILGLSYLMTAAIAIFFSSQLFYLMNIGPKLFKVLEPIPESSEHFWVVLAAGHWVTQAFLCFLSAETPSVKGYALVQILSKVVTCLGFAYFLITSRPYFAYLVGIIIESTIGLWLVFWVIRVSFDHERKKDQASPQPHPAGSAAVEQGAPQS